LYKRRIDHAIFANFQALDFNENCKELFEALKPEETVPQCEPELFKGMGYIKLPSDDGQAGIAFVLA